jgi:hypothetical protein
VLGSILPVRDVSERMDVRMSHPEGFELWAKYEDVAMHFNTLLIQFRVQLIGGLTALTTVGGYLIGEKVHERKQRFGILTLYSFILLAAWIGAAALDLLYYSHLLKGAVAAILEIEEKSGIRFSKVIEEGMGWGTWGPRLFYGLVTLALLLLFGWSGWKYLHTSITGKAA